MRKLKESNQQYRNINGIFFTFYTADSFEIPIAIQELKIKKLKYRIIDGQLYIETKLS